MTIEEQHRYKIELEDAEKQTLDNAIGVLQELKKRMEQNNCDVVVSGYADCEYYLKNKDVEFIIDGLAEVYGAWEIRKRN